MVLAIKQNPSRHYRTKSIADNADEVAVRDQAEPLLSQRGGIDRRSNYNKTDSELVLF